MKVSAMLADLAGVMIGIQYPDLEAAVKIFLSWSGEKSGAVATAMRDCLPTVVPGLHPWMSTKDIAAGQQWISALNHQIEVADYCILFVHPSNLSSQWLYFEAGALAKRFLGTKDMNKTIPRLVCPYLLGLKPEDLKSTPLEQFQAKVATKASTYELIETLYRLQRRTANRGERLKLLFEEKWPMFEAFVNISPIRTLWLMGTTLVHSTDHNYSDLPKKIGGWLRHQCTSR